MKEHQKILQCVKKRDGAGCEKEMVYPLRALDKYLRDIQKPLKARISWAPERSLGRRKKELFAPQGTFKETRNEGGGLKRQVNNLGGVPNKTLVKGVFKWRSM